MRTLKSDSPVVWMASKWVRGDFIIQASSCPTADPSLSLFPSYSLSLCLSHSTALVSATICPCFSISCSLLSPLYFSLSLIAISCLYLSVALCLFFFLSLNDVLFFSLTHALPPSLPFPSSLSSTKPSKNLRLLSWPARTALFSS